jgi:hypothetical protein
VIADADRGIEEAARILAEVEDELLHPLALQLLERVAELANGRRREVLDADVADAGADHQHVADRVRGDGGAGDRERDRLFDADAQDLDVDGGALRSLQLLDDVVEREIIGGGAFDFGDDVAGADAEARGGRPFERGDDGDLIVAFGDEDAEAVEAALLAILHVGVLLRLEEGGVGVEGAEHAVDGGVDDLVGADVVSGPGGDGREQIRVLFHPLLHVVLLHRRAEEAVAVEAAEERRSEDRDEQRERETPLLRLLDFGHSFCRLNTNAKRDYSGGLFA